MLHPRRRAFVLALVCLALSVPLTAQSLDPGTDPGWIQPRANAAGTAAVDFVAPLAEPAELFRHDLGELLAVPVSWGSSLYALTRDGRDRTLSVIDLDTGELVDSIGADSGAEAHLAVWQGTVLVVDPDGARTFRHDGDALKSGRRIRGTFHGGPCVVNGTAFLTGPEELVALDIVRGRVLEEVELLAYGKPAFRPGDDGGRLAVQRFDELRTGQHELLLTTLPVSEIGTRKPKFGEPEDLRVERVLRAPSPSVPCYAVTLGVDDEGDDVWYLQAPAPVRIRREFDLGGLMVVGRFGPHTSAPYAHAPAFCGDALFGFDSDGVLVRTGEDAKTEPLIRPDDLPQGARVAPVTAAQGVVLLGNWAVEVGSRRVLWCLPDLAPAGPLLPVAPGRLVAWTEDGTLVVLGAATSAEGAVADAAVERTAAQRPHADRGVVLADGFFLAGTIEDSREGWIVTPEDGEPRELEAREVAWIESGDDSLLVGDEYPVFALWRDALDREAGEALLEHFPSYARVDLVDDCRRLLDEARQRGVDVATLETLEAELLGATQSTASNADRQRARILREEEATRERLVEAYLEGVEWCEVRRLTTAATALLAHLDRFQPGLDVVEERADVLVPRDFPWADEPDSARTWMVWAEQILPAGAKFLPESSRAWEPLADSVWESKTLGFGTRNLVLFSKCEDPEVVGACLRNGEGAVRVLEDLLGDADRATAPPRLDVRVHASREDYLEEELPGGYTAATWSAGFYSPVDRVSRFYASEESADPLGRALHEVLAHELTHQWLNERWIEADDDVTERRLMEPGFWIVEGFATFIGDQAVELGRRQGLDDPTVPSVDAMVKLHQDGHVLDMDDFVDGTQIDFHELSDAFLSVVRLSNTLAAYEMTQRNLFYTQAGALVFFLMNRCGPEGREALVRYMKDYYELGNRRRSWKKLGFDDADELRDAFVEFLGELGG